MRFIQTSFGITNCEHITHLKLEEGHGWSIVGSLLGRDHEFSAGRYKTYKEAEFVFNKILKQLGAVIIDTSQKEDE